MGFVVCCEDVESPRCATRMLLYATGWKPDYAIIQAGKGQHSRRVKGSGKAGSLVGSIIATHTHSRP